MEFHQINAPVIGTMLDDRMAYFFDDIGHIRLSFSDLNSKETLNFRASVIGKVIINKKFFLIRLQKKRKNTISDNTKFVGFRNRLTQSFPEYATSPATMV